MAVAESLRISTANEAIDRIVRHIEVSQKTVCTQQSVEQHRTFVDGIQRIQCE